MSFQIHALPAEAFAPYFELGDAELAARNMRRSQVTSYPSTPCRVSLKDAQVGETVLLLNYAHQTEETPFKATHAIFVRKGATQARLPAGHVPDVLSRRLMSVRLFDEDHMMIDADVVDGTDLTGTLESAFADANVSYIHLHNAKQGCFAASVTRAA